MKLDLDARSAGYLLEKLRVEKPLVQCITNFVSMDIMANCLLAIGASPAMVGYGPHTIILSQAIASAQHRACCHDSLQVDTDCAPASMYP